MDFSPLINDILKLGPVVGLLLGGLYFTYKDKVKSEAEQVRLRGEKNDLVNRLISDKEKRLMQDAQTMNVMEKLLDKSGSTTEIMREAFGRMEQNQKEMMEDIRDLKSKIL